MIETRDFKRLIAEAEHRYPPTHSENLERAWWAARGVNLDALKAWAISEALDDVGNTLPQTEAVHSADPATIIAGGFAMAYHMGFIFGWLLCEQERGQ